MDVYTVVSLLIECGHLTFEGQGINPSDIFCCLG
jgi:hypothetical protein